MKNLIKVISNYLNIEEKKLKKISLILGIIISILTIFAFFSKENDDKTIDIINSTNTKVVDSSTTNIDLSTTKNDNSSTTNIYLDSTQPKTISYKLIGKNNIELKRIIEKSTNIKITNNSDNTIEITHTGQIKLLSKDSQAFIYSGGNIEVLINGSLCHDYIDFKISSMRPNSQETIIKNIQKVINNIVNHNINIFSNKIIQCIKG